MITQILKRLEIIKSSITIEDEEIIELQISKILSLDIDIDDEVQTILQKLKNAQYSDASMMIDAYLLKFSGVTIYVDPELSGLKLELKTLENRFQELFEQKTEYLNALDEFNREYNLHVGDIIKSILNLKKEILYKQTIKLQNLKTKYQEDLRIYDDTQESIFEIKSTVEELKETLGMIDENNENYKELLNAYNDLQDELSKLEANLAKQYKKLEKIKKEIDDDTSFKQYEEAKRYYDEFDDAYEHIKEEQKDTIKINEQDKAELKRLYRKAAKLCHPDMISDNNLKQQSTEIMQQLNNAYKKQDLAQIKKILDTLENSLESEILSDQINDKELLKEKIEKYKEKIANLESEIDDILDDDTYQTIATLEDWDAYFDELKEDLKAEKQMLEKEDRNLQ